MRAFLYGLAAQVRAALPWHPEKRLAERKRALERICLEQGTSNTQAKKIAARFFAKGT